MNQIMHTGRSFHRKPCRASISGAISPLLIEFLRLRNGSQRFLVVVPFGGPAVDVGALHLAPIAGALRVFDKRRSEQQVRWMWTMLEDRWQSKLRADPAIRAKVRATETAVAAGRIAPSLAADQIASWLV